MKSAYKVYLSGPITGLSFSEAVGWTDYAIERFIQETQNEIVGYKPLRGKEFLKDVVNLDAMGYATNPLSGPQAIVGRDRYDVETTDAMLVNLLDAKRVSIGTMYEMAWAFYLRKPVVLVMENDGTNVHQHCFVEQSCTHRCHDIDTGINLIKSILLPS